MAKEMMIVFIYDTIKNHEFHDPAKSVIYFHPSWVSENQKLLLCGQLVGTAHFLNETLFKPRIISLQSGKFAIKTFGRFLLAVGSDRNMSEIVLEHRANFLYILIQMYHCDVNSIYEHFNSNEHEQKFVDKMYSIMESYLPLLQFNGNIFQNVSSLKIPKSASNLYLETNQILQSFQQTKGVLGGTILYHNKVVASQLSDNLTKIFTLSDLYRLKSSEYIAANYHIPIGVTLINAYIPEREYTELARSSTQSYNLFINSTAKEIIPFQVRKKSFSKDAYSLIKRDKSLIFTHIPEEDLDDGVGAINTSHKRKTTFSRPTYLPLLMKNPTSLDITESGFNSINFDETDSFPNFIGKTSVCSTPMTENKVLPQGNVLSICAASEKNNLEEKIVDQKEDERDKLHLVCEEKTIQKLLQGKMKQTNNIYFTGFISNSHKTNHTRSSMPNMLDIFTEADNQNPYEVNSKQISTLKMKKQKNRDLYRTIADPAYPIFNSNGCAISYSLFEEFLNQNYNEMKKISTKSDIQPNVEKMVPKTNGKNADELGSLFRTNSTKSRDDLNLPLKALDLRGTVPIQACKILDSPVRRKKLSGLQLTPLMSKLSILAMSDQQSSGFSSWDTTPGCNFNNPLTPLEYQPKHRKSKTYSSGGAENDRESLQDIASKSVKVELFICVQQNMTLVLVLREKSSEKEDMIHSLFETCVSKLSRIENSLHQVMSINVEGFDKGEGGYSFICLDSKWDVINRCGPWAPRDLLTLNLIHNNFHYNRRLIELILKSQDTVIYSYRCGRSEIYYQQSTIVQPGLPPPQDVMGTVSLCAKRRLERDHEILLL